MLTAMLAVAALAVVGFGVPLAVLARSHYERQALLLLSDEATRAVISVPRSFWIGRDPPELPNPAGQVSIALYGADGQRLQGRGPGRADRTVSDALHGNRSSSLPDMVVAVPVIQDEVTVGAVRASLSPDVVAQQVRQAWMAMGALAAAVLAAASALAVRASRRLSMPLARLGLDAAIVGAGGEVPPWPTPTTPEVDEVQLALSEASRRLGSALERERAFSVDVAHQLRTPLASLRLRLETDLHQQTGGASTAAALQDIDRLDRTVNDLLHLTRDHEPPSETHPLATAVREAAQRWDPEFAKVGRPLVVDSEHRLPWVTARPAAIRQILDVLLDNALQHGAGMVRLSASRVGEGSVVEVADQGSSVVDPAHIFAGNNGKRTSGIGLRLARRLAEAEDLRLVLTNPGPGVTFHLIFGSAHRNAAAAATRRH